MATATSCLTLLTDFGLQDVYVGVMKGSIAQIAPTLSVIDLTHTIAPQDLPAARFNLMVAYPYFPASTVHVVVVDPGVGSSRRAIALSLPEGNPPGIIVAPDNGVVSGVLDQQTPAAIASMQVVELNNPNYWRILEPSRTFHGRDIFAPVGAHLASGVPLGQIGDKIEADSLVRLSIPPATAQPDCIKGTIQYIDHFGNGITTIPAALLQSEGLQLENSLSQSTQSSRYWLKNNGAKRPLIMNLYTMNNTHVIPCRTTYAEVSSGTGVALMGSHGWLEISVNQGSAAKTFDMTVGDIVEMRFASRSRS